MTHKHFTEAEAEAFADQRGGEFMHASGTWRLTPEALHAAMEAAADAAMLKCRNDWGLAVEKAYQLGEAAAQAALAKQGEPVASDRADLIRRLRNTPNWMRESYGSWKDCTMIYDRAPFEAADALESEDALKVIAVEELYQLGYTVRDGLLYPPDTTPQPAAQDKLREALQFYADGLHFTMHDKDAWDTVSGEPQNFWEDENNTATVEDGSIARATITKIKEARG